MNDFTDAAKPRCRGRQKNGKRCTAAGRFPGKHGLVCATHLNSEKRARGGHRGD